MTSENKSVETAVVVIVKPDEKNIKRKPDKRPLKRLKMELQKHKNNLKMILQCTNATPILRRGSIGYRCSYCVKEFPDPKDLKKHTLAAHPAVTGPVIGYLKRVPMSEYYAKLDITNLNCMICCANINNLENLLNHLKDEHNKTVHTDINNHIIPFKFDTEQLTCCVCFNVFNKFKQLHEHMHKHYRNFVCDVCDSGYINQGCLTRHAHTHLKGEFSCEYCTKTFDTYLKKKSHERCNHTHTNVLNRCGYCNERFRDHYLKEQHMLKAHGIKPKVNKCEACDKCFPTHGKLRAHIKRDHLLERRHKCLYCDMKFFTPHDARKHMVKHTGAKEFQCEVCLKSYGRKSTLDSHMRIHNDDRRFKCEHCGRAFVQKCSLKGHLKSKHGESL